MRRRVCIVGGGIAGLTAAYELTRTAESRARFEVEVVELSHRLGGRLASHHNSNAWGRNEEHGLHVWFGFYDNTLRLAEQVWRDVTLPADCPWDTVYDGLRPISWSDHGLPVQGSYAVRRVHWGARHDLLHANPDQAIVQVMQGVARAILHGPSNVASFGFGVDWDPRWSRLSRTLRRLEPGLARTLQQLTRVQQPSTLTSRRQLARGVRTSLAMVHAPLVRALLKLPGDPALIEMIYALDLALTMLRGFCDPAHGVVDDGNLDRVSAWELRDWLRHHGANPKTLQHSQWLHAVYDIPLAFRDGHRDQPIMEASTALRYTLRMALGYRDTMAYLLSAGADQTLVAPLVSLLRQRGVRFRLFHRLQDLDIDHGEITRLHLVRAARATPDYDPLHVRHHFHAMRDGPDYSKIEGGAMLRERGASFVDRFGDRGETERVTLRVGEQFDDVILALPLGCVKQDGDGHSPVQTWLDHHTPAKACLQHLHLVPTVAAQLWFDEPPDELGLVDRAIVTWAPPYSVLCDMSPVITHEDWPAPGPQTCVYLCGPWPLQAHKAPSTEQSAPRRDEEEARRSLKMQLAQHGASALGHASLHRPPGVDDPWTAQYVRANVQPWDLADLPLPSANTHRLEAADTGLQNLALAGTWVRNPINTTSVEGAVCSGIAAARAVGARVQPILAESWLRKPPETLVLDRQETVDVRIVAQRPASRDPARHRQAR